MSHGYRIQPCSGRQPGWVYTMTVVRQVGYTIGMGVQYSVYSVPQCVWCMIVVGPVLVIAVRPT